MFGEKIGDAKIKDIVDEYCKSLKNNNISVIAINLDQIFTIKKGNRDYHSAILKDGLQMIEGRKLFFTYLFRQTLCDDYFRLVIVVNLYTDQKIIDDTYANHKIIYNVDFNKNDGTKIKAKTYCKEYTYLKNLLINMSPLMVTKKKTNCKIVIIPHITYEPEVLVDLKKKFEDFKIKTRLLTEYILTYSLLLDIFKIPAYECVFICKDNIIPYNNSIFSTSGNNHFSLHIYMLAIHNFTNNNLTTYGNKFIKKLFNTSKITGNTHVCVIMDNTIMSSEQLDFVICSKPDSIIILTDNGENKWENGILYCDKKKFL